MDGKNNEKGNLTGVNLDDIRSLLDNCRQLSVEAADMQHGIDFLINEYKTNKNYFRLEPGKPTIEDIIKTCFEFGWSSCRQFDLKR